MKSVMIALMLMFTSVVVAQASDRTTIDTAADLTAAQKAELAATAAKMASENAAGVKPAAPAATTAQTVKEWAEVGTAIGTGLAASAKELGIAANEFAQTPVGRFTVFLIAWHFVGGTILHVIFAFLWMFFAAGILFYVWRRSCFRITTSTFDKGAGPGGATKTVVKEPIRLGKNDEVQPIHFFLGFGTAIYVIVLAVMLCNL